MELIAVGLFGLLILLGLAFRRLSHRLDAQFFANIALRRELSALRDEQQVNQQHVDALTRTLFEGLIITDSQHRILQMNPAAVDLFQAGPDPINKSLISITRNHEIDELITQVLSTGEVLETQLPLEDRTLTIRARVDPLEGGSRVIVAFQDVTELLRLTRARRDMVANLSHDLRTPISNIRLLVDSLTMAYGKNADKDKKTLGKIAGVAEGLQHMTQELVDLSTIESGKAIMRMVENNLGDLVRSALTYVESQIDQKKMDIQNQVPGDIRILADTDQMRRVITNILHNAVKFTPEGGQVMLTTRRDSTAANSIVLSIKDTGPGIPPSERNRIFERFYQIDSARSNKPSDLKGNSTGTGLGLAIAKHIVEAHGGRIWAEAGIPSGACICLSLPLA